MRWQKQVGRETGSPRDAVKLVPERQERTSPGLAAFFESVAGGSSENHSVLDLAAATGRGLRVYEGFARWVRFVDLFETPAATRRWRDYIVPGDGKPYNLILAWDVLDRVPDQDRPGVVERLTQVSAPGARLFAIVATEGEAAASLHRFGLLDIDRMLCESIGDIPPAGSPLLPAEVQRVLTPFEVIRGFSSGVGIREYLAVRKDR